MEEPTLVPVEFSSRGIVGLFLAFILARCTLVTVCDVAVSTGLEETSFRKIESQGLNTNSMSIIKPSSLARLWSITNKVISHTFFWIGQRFRQYPEKDSR